MSSSIRVESSAVETSDGVKLNCRVFKPREEESLKDNLVIVLVHPYTVMGGCQALLKGMASGLASHGYKAVTFDMRGAGRSTGKASLTGFSEVKDVITVCKWVSDNLSTDRILLLGSSAGAAIAGSAVDEVEQVVGYIGVGYTFGMLASILFGRHQKAILQSSKPKLFIMGTRDGFTSVKQLKNKLSSAAGRVETHLIDGAGHFQMEGPDFDAQMYYYPSLKCCACAILQSSKPKLFIMGTRDGFTSVKQLKNKLISAAGRVETHVIDGAGHFQMEGPDFDAQMEIKWLLSFFNNMNNWPADPVNL